MVTRILPLLIVMLVANSVNCWELLLHNGKDNQQRSSKQENVQRLFRKEVHSSEWKCRTSIKDDDIVCSIWKHIAVERRIQTNDLYRTQRKKGFHIYIHKDFVKYDADYEEKWNKISKEFAKYIIYKFKIDKDYIDFSIYDNVRILRYPFSIHPGTSMEKSLILYTGFNENDPGKSFTKLSPNKAETLKEIFEGLPLIESTKVFDLTQNIPAPIVAEAEITEVDNNSYLDYPFGEKLCIYKMLNTRNLVGSRHTVALRLQAYWAGKGYNKAYTVALLNTWNSGLDKQLTSQEMSNITKYYDKKYTFNCKDPVKRKFCIKSCHFYSTKDEEDIFIYTGNTYLHRYRAELSRSRDAWIYLTDIFGWNLSPIKPGHTVVIAGAPSSGKTTFILNIMLAAKHINWLFISLEMTVESITEKFMKIKQRTLDDEDIEDSFIEDTSHISTVDKPDIKANKLQDLVRLTSNKIGKPINAVVIDYLSLLEADGHNQVEKTIMISKAIKYMVKKLKLTVFVLSQVPKSVGGDGNIPLGLDAPKDSGEVVALADLLLTVWRPNRNRPERDDNIITIGVPKNRHGIAGYTRNLRFIGEHYQIKGLQEETNE